MTELAHILVVDDDPSIRRMLQLLLSDAGYRVATTSSGEEALAYMELVTPDLILLDLMLPGMSGEQVTRQIKSDPDRPFIPIILVTARSDQQSKVAGLDAGADDLLVKPVEFNELLARMRAMLRLQRSQRSLRAEQRKTELLLHLTRELGTTLDLDELLTHFLERLADAVGAIRANIIMTSGGVQFHSSSRKRPNVPLDNILRDGLAGWVLREREPVIVEDIRDDPRWINVVDAFETVRGAAAVPIMREGRALGVITLVHHRPGYFNDEHLELLKSVAAQSAIALENAELFRLTRSQKELIERRAEELQRINQVSQHLTELMRPEQLMRLVTHLIHHTFGYPMVSILLRDDDSMIVRAVAGNLGVDVHVGSRIPQGHGVISWVAEHQEPLIVADVRQDPRYLVAPADEHVRSELGVPIMTNRDVFGVLDVMSNVENAFGPTDVRLLGTLASQLGVALENTRLFEAEKRRVRQLGEVNTLSVAITAQFNLTTNMQIAVEAIASIFGVERCGIVITDPEHGSRASSSAAQAATAGVEIDYVTALQQLERAVDLGVAQLVSIAVSDARFQSLCSTLEQAEIDFIALAPLISGGRQVGVIMLDATDRIEQFGQGELTLLEAVAGLIAQVMENARLYRRVEEERGTLDAVLGGAADPILLIGPRDQLLLANRAAEQQLGLPASHDQPLTTLISQADLLHALDGQRNGNGAAPPNEVTLPGGETFSVSVAPVRGPNQELIGRVAVLQDITAIKELERREQERLRSVFRRYVSPQVVEQVLAGGADIGEPVERNVAIIFADLRGYTSLTEGLDPRVLVDQVLNRYFTAMTTELYRHEGTIDKFLGDGIIGVFGTPIAHDDDLERALAAAVHMQLAFSELRREWQRDLNLDIGMGIGISYGRAIVGNIGSRQRLDYTVIGDVVNTASRLSGVAGAGEIIVSYHLVDALPAHARAALPLRRRERVALKGKQAPHLIYAVEYATEIELTRK